MNNKLIGTLICVAVGIILVGGVMVPSLDSAKTSMTTYEYFSNESEALHLTQFDESSSITLHATASEITSEGGTYTPSGSSTFQNLILITDQIAVSYRDDGAMTVLFPTSYSSATSFTAIVSAGLLTYSINEGDAVTISYSEGLIFDPNGQYINGTGYYDDPAQISGVRFTSGVTYTSLFNKAYVGGAEANAPTITSTVVPDTEEQVKTFTGITVNGKLLQYYVSPTTATYAQEDFPAANGIIDAIPIVVIIGILVSIVAVMFRRSNA